MNTVNPSTASMGIGTTAQNTQMLLREIGAKWSKFSDQELVELKSKDDLISQVAAKYGFDRARVRRDVHLIMRDHQI